MLMHFNSQAVKNQSPVIDAEDSMTAFITMLIGRRPNKREIEVVRDQVARLSSCVISMSGSIGNHGLIRNAQVVDAYELWYPKEPGQRVLWSSRIQLSETYFQALMETAVPIDMRAVRVLQNGSLALDLYVWLTHRLVRIPIGQRVFIPWGGPNGLKTQFGYGYTGEDAMKNFKTFFKRTLARVKSTYPDANLDLDGKGMTLRSSPPAVKRSLVSVDVSLAPQLSA